ncbi:MAG: hypothetical protein ACYC96_01435 [Fimbriimonadaceae bacterium]
MFGPDTIWAIIPCMGLSIPIIALMQAHQRRMTEIIHGSRNREVVQGELDQMRAEINQLRTTVATQALALEGLANRKPIAGTADTDSLAQRLG